MTHFRIGSSKVTASKVTISSVSNPLHDVNVITVSLYSWFILQRSNLSDNDRTNIRSLLDAVISKLKYDESYDFESEGEDEIMFIEFRKQLKVLLDAIAQVVMLKSTYIPTCWYCFNVQDPSSVLHTSQNWLSSVLANVSAVPFMNLELVLRLFYMLGEVVTDKASPMQSVQMAAAV